MVPPGLHVVSHHADTLGPPVVLVHGAPDRGKNFAHVVHQLSDLPVTVYDRRGYGRSVEAALGANGELQGGFDVHADDLIALLDGTPSVVVGQSAGGTIAMLAAVRAPELVLALGVWEPPMVPYPWWVGDESMEQTMAWANAADPVQLGEDMNRLILGDDRWDGLRDSTREMLRGEGLAFRADMACQAEPLFDIDLLKVPFVAGYGTDMRDHLLAANQRLVARTGADEYIGIGADHYAHLSSPDVWAGLVRRTVELAGH
jgi:pimeloyl-ACP methyl ester carboxylesterase